MEEILGLRPIPDPILRNLDHILILQEMLLDRLTVHLRAVGAVEVFKEGVVVVRNDNGMLGADGQVVEHDIVSRSASDGNAFLGERDLPQDVAVQ
jgi:hypothetical protein